ARAISYGAAPLPSWVRGLPPTTTPVVTTRPRRGLLPAESLVETCGVDGCYITIKPDNTQFSTQAAV
uniref:Uncharacterized protein n=1 Tax=Oryza meridionalis TaxID=40149 RepID=A0A0E0E3Y4_9ORYZ